MPPQRSDLRPVLAAGALTLLALLLRFLAARQSLGGDELFTLEVANRPSLGAVLDGVRGPLEITPPGFFVFAWRSPSWATRPTGSRRRRSSPAP